MEPNAHSRGLKCGLLVSVLLATGCGGSRSVSAVPTTASSALASGESSGAPLGASTDSPSGGSDAPMASSSPSPPPDFALPPMPANLRAPARPWAQMTARERGAYMHDVVLPAAQALFREYDPAAYANVTCATCHGVNARAVHFRMPNSLPRLHPFGSAAAREMAAAQPRKMAFMGQRVLPAMALMLGQERYNPETHQGFGCLGCHPSAAAPSEP